MPPSCLGDTSPPALTSTHSTPCEFELERLTERKETTYDGGHVPRPTALRLPRTAANFSVVLAQAMIEMNATSNVGATTAIGEHVYHGTRRWRVVHLLFTHPALRKN